MDEITAKYRPVMRTREVAELLGCSEKHVRDLCRDRTIPAALIGGRWMIDRDALLGKLRG